MKRMIAIIIVSVLSLPLSAQSVLLQERLDSSVVSADRKRLNPLVIPIQTVDLRRVVSPMGDADLVKFVQTLPGVSTGMEGSSAYYVRGGNVGNNRVTLDGVPLYGTGHLLGLTTSYPSEVLAESSFFTGGFPGESGGYISSLLSLTSMDGDFRKPRFSASVNTFMVGAQASTPLKKDRLSLLASLRFSPLGWAYNTLRPLVDAELDIPDRLASLIGDAFLKLTWRQSPSEDVSFSVFGSEDHYSYSRSETSSRGLGWSNLIANLKWRKETADGARWESQLSFNGYSSFQKLTAVPVVGVEQVTKMSIQSSVRELMLQSAFSKTLRNGIVIKSGLDIKGASFAPGVSKSFMDSSSSASSGRRLLSGTGTVFGQMAFERGAFHTRSALKASAFLADGYKTVKPVVDVYLAYDLEPVTLVATYDHLAQFYHTLEGIPTGWSLDMMVPSTSKNHPETSDQVYLGATFSKNRFGLTLGGFYKHLKDIVYFSDAASFFNSSWGAWQNSIDSGVGLSCGMELSVLYEGERLSGRGSYTLSKTDRSFPSINVGDPFPFKFDRTHILNVSMKYDFSKGDQVSQGVSSGLVWSSGHWESVSSGTYPVWMLGPESDRLSFEVDYYSHPNNLRLPDYFRWDLGYQIRVKASKSRHDLSIGVYNLTNRHNAYGLYWDSEKATWKKMSIFPFFPNVSYRIAFGG